MPPPPQRTLPPLGERGADLGDDEPITNPRIALADLQHPDQVDPVKLHEYLAEKRAQDAEAFMAKVKALAAAIAVVGGAVIAAIIFIDNRVQAQTDAGVRVHEMRLGTLEQQRSADRSENNARFERLEAGQARTDAKLDAILDRLRVPNPAPTPKDGGTP